MKRDAATTYRIMSAIKSKDTKPEKVLGSAIWKTGLRYRKHYKIIGKPDFVFVKAKIAIFCDGDFWHGHNWKIRGIKNLEEELKNYAPFWSEKIRRNVERDKKINKMLKKTGWLVLRFWESDIKNSPNLYAKRIKAAYEKRK